MKAGEGISGKPLTELVEQLRGQLAIAVVALAKIKTTAAAFHWEIADDALAKINKGAR